MAVIVLLVVVSIPWLTHFWFSCVSIVLLEGELTRAYEREEEIVKLYFGCGRHEFKGFIGVEKIQTGQVDFVRDMNVYAYAFADNAIN